MDNTQNPNPVNIGMNPNQVEALRTELAEMRDLIKENHRMIRRLYKSTRISFIFSTLKWIIIIGVTIGAFVYIQPLFENLLKTYSSVGGLGSGPNGESMMDLWKGLK
jgi:hypothetical protein